MVIARIDSRNVHSIVPDQKEWLNIVACINAAGHSIPNIYILKGVKENYELSSTSRNLLILDGHNSHMTLEVIHKAAQAGIDMITLPSHTSHALQPLDISVFAPIQESL
jgi:hypothetical protein